MLTHLDQKIIRRLVRDIPLIREPFKEIARELGIEEEELLRRMAFFKKKGLMRKFSASLNHQKIGMRHNAMVVWNASSKGLPGAGRFMASLPQISHCYQRKKRPGWNYNLYSMIHGRTRQECLDVVQQVRLETGIEDYQILFSTREYKKSGITYQR